MSCLPYKILRKNIAKSAAPFALSTAQIELLESVEDPVAHAYFLGMTKHTLQKLRYSFYCFLLFLFFTIISFLYYIFDYFNRYTLWGEVHTFLNNSVFLKTGLRGFPQVQTHLGLTGPNESRSIMDVYASTTSISNIVYPCFHCSWGSVYVTICPIYIPNSEKTKQKKRESDSLALQSRDDDNKSSLLMKHYDADVHEALARFCMLDGSSFSEKAGQSVNFFTEKGKAKCWFKKK